MKGSASSSSPADRTGDLNGQIKVGFCASCASNSLTRLNYPLRADSLEQTLMLGKIEEKRTTKDEMVGWPHQLNGHEFEQAQGDSEG